MDHNFGLNMSDGVSIVADDFSNATLPDLPHLSCNIHRINEWGISCLMASLSTTHWLTLSERVWVVLGILKPESISILEIPVLWGNNAWESRSKQGSRISILWNPSWEQIYVIHMSVMKFWFNDFNESFLVWGGPTCTAFWICQWSFLAALLWDLPSFGLSSVHTILCSNCSLQIQCIIPRDLKSFSHLHLLNWLNAPKSHGIFWRVKK